MADAAAFDFVCEELERATSLSLLEARGTVRLALKAAGVEARSVSPAQLRVVLDKLIPGELRKRGCEEADSVCRDIGVRLASRSFDAPAGGDSPEAVFARLGGGSS
jgi:hypothetical protein